MEQRSSAQLEFMTSYRRGPPVRPSYGLHAGRCSEFGRPSPRAGLQRKSVVQYFESSPGRSMTVVYGSEAGQLQVHVWHHV